VESGERNGRRREVGLRYGLLPKQIENAFLNERSILCNSFHFLLIQLVYTLPTYSTSLHIYKNLYRYATLADPGSAGLQERETRKYAT